MVERVKRTITTLDVFKCNQSLEISGIHDSPGLKNQTFLPPLLQSRIHTVQRDRHDPNQHSNEVLPAPGHGVAYRHALES
jgi:hypothetical protein